MTIATVVKTIAIVVRLIATVNFFSCKKGKFLEKEVGGIPIYMQLFLEGGGGMINIISRFAAIIKHILTNKIKTMKKILTKCLMVVLGMVMVINIVNATPTVSVTGHANPACSNLCDGSIEVTVTNAPSGGIPYATIDGDVTLPTEINYYNGGTTWVMFFNHICTGYKTIIIYDFYFFSPTITVGTSDFTLTAPSEIVPNITATHPPICLGGNDGFITLHPSGGTGTYHFKLYGTGGNQNNSPFTQGPDANGDYSIFNLNGSSTKIGVIDQSGCSVISNPFALGDRVGSVI